MNKRTFFKTTVGVALAPFVALATTNKKQALKPLQALDCHDVKVDNVRAYHFTGEPCDDHNSNVFDAHYQNGSAGKTIKDVELSFRQVCIFELAKQRYKNIIWELYANDDRYIGKFLWRPEYYSDPDLKWKALELDKRDRERRK